MKSTFPFAFSRKGWAQVENSQVGIPSLGLWAGPTGKSGFWISDTRISKSSGKNPELPNFLQMRLFQIALLAFQKTSPNTVRTAKKEGDHTSWLWYLWPQSELAEDTSCPQSLAQLLTLDTEDCTFLTRTSCLAASGSGRGSRGWDWQMPGALLHSCKRTECRRPAQFGMEVSKSQRSAGGRGR